MNWESPPVIRELMLPLPFGSERYFNVDYNYLYFILIRIFVL